MSVLITGLGVLGIFGKGKNALTNAIETNKTTDHYDSLDIDINSMKDKALSSRLRRADRFTKMSVLAVNDALNDYGIDNLNLEQTGIILTTAFGPHNTTFAFLDELVTYGEKNVSAIKFSHSVHNAAASYIAQIFNIKGPVSTVTQFKFPVQNALSLATCWLQSKLCDNVLVCCSDERGDIFNLATSNNLNVATDNTLDPSNFSTNAKAVPTEGSVCLLLTGEKNSSSSYCKISNINFDGNISKNTDCLIAGSDGIPTDQTTYKNLLNNQLPINVFSPIYGSMIIGVAFDIAIAILLLKKNSSINTGNFSINQRSLKEPANCITCIKINCNNQTSSTELSNVKEYQPTIN